jgi:hypothetical protein
MTRCLAAINEVALAGNASAALAAGIPSLELAVRQAGVRHELEGMWDINEKAAIEELVTQLAEEGSQPLCEALKTKLNAALRMVRQHLKEKKKPAVSWPPLASVLAWKTVLRRKQRAHSGEVFASLRPAGILIRGIAGKVSIVCSIGMQLQAARDCVVILVMCHSCRSDVR